ncbi:MAG: hypothetical protein KH046_06280 [Stenotrophomonas maltophilia]|nr:hypothetical protein [Stenotrophomonas maltophilia]
MSTHNYFVSKASVRNLKQLAARKIDGVSSSHLSEAVAAALDFKTHAALVAALRGSETIGASKPSNERFNSRLRQFGYHVRPDLKLLPDLKQSYGFGKRYPIQAKRGARWNAWRNLMVAAINAGLEQRLFGLSPDDDWWPGADTSSRGHYRFAFDGDLPAVASVASIGAGELSISVLLDPDSPDIEAEFGLGIRDGKAAAHGWFERRLGVWLMDGGEDFSCKRMIQQRVAAARVESAGYSDIGSFIM